MHLLRLGFLNRISMSMSEFRTDVHLVVESEQVAVGPLRPPGLDVGKKSTVSFQA